MVNIEELKRKKNGMVQEARAFTILAEKEKRALTGEENMKVDALLKDIREINGQIETEERSQALAMAGGGVAGSHRNGYDRQIELNEEDRSLLRFIREGSAALDRYERRALVEDTTGEYIVSPAIEQELQRKVAALVVARQLASKRTTDKDRVRIRDIEEAQVGWGKLETGAAITESTPAPSERTIYVEDLYGLIKIGEDELQDSDYDLAAFLADTFARAIAEKENTGFLKGAGHAADQPEGITLDPTLIAAAKTTASTGAVTIEDFLQCIYVVPPKYRPGSAWIVNSLTELEIRKLRWDGGGGAGTGGYFWQPSVKDGAPNTFLGYPIYNQDDLDDLSDVAGIIGIFGNFDIGYRIYDRMGTTIQRLNELYAEDGLVGFKCHTRVTGTLLRPANKALVLLQEKP